MFKGNIGDLNIWCIMQGGNQRQNKLNIKVFQHFFLLSDITVNVHVVNYNGINNSEVVVID